MRKHSNRMNSQDRSYLNKNNNPVKENASGWVLTTSFGSSVISGMLIGLLIEYFFDPPRELIYGGLVQNWSKFRKFSEKNDQKLKNSTRFSSKSDRKSVV